MSHAIQSVALLTGGPGPEREGSLISGADVSAVLGAYDIRMNVIDLNAPERIAGAQSADAAFLTTHGWWGEDGKLQGALELLGIPYTGSGVLASATAMHKPTACRLAESVGVRTPEWSLVDLVASPEQEAQRLTRVLGNALFIKPTSGGGSLNAGVCQGAEQVSDFLLGQRDVGQQFMASRLIQGIDISVGLLSGRDGKLSPLPTLATHYDRPFYDYEVKHNRALRRHSCPADLTAAAEKEVTEAALAVAAALGVSGVARVDFLCDGDGQPWFLEVNTIPGMSRHGNLAQMAIASGLSYEGLVLSVLQTAGMKTGYTP